MILRRLWTKKLRSCALAFQRCQKLQNTMMPRDSDRYLLQFQAIVWRNAGMDLITLESLQEVTRSQNLLRSYLESRLCPFPGTQPGVERIPSGAGWEHIARTCRIWVLWEDIYKGLKSTKIKCNQTHISSSFLFTRLLSLCSFIILWNLLVCVLQGVQRFYEDKIAQPSP